MKKETVDSRESRALDNAVENWISLMIMYIQEKSKTTKEVAEVKSLADYK